MKIISEFFREAREIEPGFEICVDGMNWNRVAHVKGGSTVFIQLASGARVPLNCGAGVLSRRPVGGVA